MVFKTSLLANEGGSNVTVLLGNGSRSGFQRGDRHARWPVGAVPYSVAVGDFNGDGILDIVASNFTSNDVTILLGNGSGGFSAATGGPFAVGTGPYSVAVGDFNRDGRNRPGNRELHEQQLSTVLLGGSAATGSIVLSWQPHRRPLSPGHQSRLL